MSEHEEFRRRLAGLIHKWLGEQMKYPDTEAGNHAAAAVRCCAKELGDVLNPPQPAPYGHMSRANPDEDPTDSTKPREPGCKCHWEEGDSPCPVHGENEEPKAEERAGAIVIDPESIRILEAEEAENAAEQGASVWLLTRDNPTPGIGPLYLDRRRWEDRQEVRWTPIRPCALTCPTQAEAIMFAREYLPELEGEIAVVRYDGSAGHQQTKGKD